MSTDSWPTGDAPSVLILLRDDVATLYVWQMGTAEAGRELAALRNVLTPIYGEIDPHKPIQAWDRDSVYCHDGYMHVHAVRLAEITEILIEAEWMITPPDDEGTHLRRITLQQRKEPARNLTTYQRRLIDSLDGQTQGQIYSDASDTHELIAILASSFAHTNVLIVAKNRANADRLADYLRENTEREVSVGKDVTRTNSPHIHIDCLAGMIRTADDWNVLIFADVESAVSATGMAQAISMNGALIYTFRENHSRRDWEDRLRLRIISGEEIYRLDNRPIVLAKVTVLTVPARPSGSNRQSDPLRDKQRQIYRNEARNQQIAQLAIAFAERAKSVLHAQGLRAPVVERILAQSEQPPRVAIIVESAQHARVLRRHLAWPIAAGARNEDDTGALPLSIDKLIVTRTRAVAAGIAVDVVIVADGTSTAWHDAYGPYYGRNGAEMLVIDMQDSYDRHVRQWAEMRIGDYQARGYNVWDSVINDADTNWQADEAVGDEAGKE